MNKLIPFFALFLFCFPRAYGQSVSLKRKWETDTLLRVPESVLPDPSGKFFYVSNVDGTDSWGRDGRGSIGKIDLNGRVIDTAWVSGFNAPKGMALWNGRLYVADFENLVVVDVAMGRILKTIKISGAVGLNDVAVDKNGILYVSDSKAKRIFRVENEMPAVFLDSLKGPNGLLIRNDKLYAVDGEGLFSIGEDKKMTLIASGLSGGNTDGLTSAGDRDFFVSLWQGTIWYVYEDGRKELLLDSRKEKKNTADIWFDPVSGILYVPGFWTNTIVAYQVN